MRIPVHVRDRGVTAAICGSHRGGHARHPFQDVTPAAREATEHQLAQRKVELPGTAEITGYVADFRALLQRGTFPERKALLRNFVQGIEVVDDAATLTYTVPMPADGVTREGVPVLDFFQSGLPTLPLTVN